MLKEGTRFILTQSIEGKIQEFNQGLEGTVIECVDRESGLSYRIQFIDGRVAAFPSELLTKATETIKEE